MAKWGLTAFERLDGRILPQMANLAPLEGGSPTAWQPAAIFEKPVIRSALRISPFLLGYAADACKIPGRLQYPGIRAAVDAANSHASALQQRYRIRDPCFGHAAGRARLPA